MAKSIFFLTILPFWLAPVFGARPQADGVSFRLITTATEAKAVELRARILAGESFESVATANSTDRSAAAGGFMGTVVPADLRQEFRTALSGLRPGQVSPVVKMGNEFFLLQLLALEEADWITRNAAGVEALRKGRYAEAVQLLTAAIDLAGKFGSDDDRLGQSLNNLGEAYQIGRAHV